MSDEIREAVNASGKSRYSIAKSIGIAESTMSRFMNGKGGLSMEFIDLLADLLGLHIVVKPAKKARGEVMASFRKHGKVWYYRHVDADGIKRETKGCTDRRATEEIARAAESAAARAKAGLTDPKTERIAREARRPIAEHVAEFIAGMESKGNDPKHVRSTRSYIERVIKLASIKRIGDLTPSSVSVAVTALKAENLSARAVNAYLTAIKSFSRWLKRDGRISDYALETLTKQNEQADRRRIRRALTPEEASKVIKAAETGAEAGGLAGPDRAMLYTLALGTGFRADELATLTADRFALDADPPTVTVMACYAKNRTEAVQPIAAALADQLRPWVALKAPGGRYSME